MCFVRGWDAAKILRKGTGFDGTLGGLEDMDMPMCRSGPTGQATWTRGTPGRMFVSRSAPDNAERGHLIVSSSASSSPPSPRVYLATWRGSRCVRSFHECMPCRFPVYN